MSRRHHAALAAPKAEEMENQEVKEEEKGVPVEVAEKADTGFDSFEKMVAYFKEKIEGVSKVTLQLCWEMGEQVNLIKEQAVYGENTVDTFAETLGIPNINVKTLYRYGQFCQSYTRGELRQAMAKPHVGWGVVNKLISIRSKEDRTEFEDKLAAEKIKPSELDDKIGEYMNKLRSGSSGKVKEAKGKATSRNFTRNAKRITGLLETIQPLLPLLEKDFADLSEIAGDEDKYGKALEAIFSFREMAETVLAPLKKLHDAAGKIA